MLSIDTATNIDFSSGVFVQIKSSIKSQEDEKEESEEHIGNDSKDGDDDEKEFTACEK